MAEVSKVMCPECRKFFVEKVLNRHKREVHSSKPPKFKCDTCEFTTKRNVDLLAHIQRKHTEPTKIGRPKKNVVHRKRSPFRLKKKTVSAKSDIGAADGRIKESIEESKKELEDLKLKLADKEKETNNLKAKVNEMARIHESSLKDIQIRLNIVEKKCKQSNLIDFDDVSSMLTYLNLDESATIADIRDAINIRILEVSNESLVDSGATEDMSSEEREAMTTRLNQIQQKLIEWKSKPQSKPIETNK